MADTAHPSCFVALLPHVSTPPAQLCSIAAGTGLGFNWFHPSYMHLTICYIGWLRSHEFQAIEQQISYIHSAKPIPPAITLTGELEVVGPEELRSLVAPVVKSTQLMELRDLTATAIERLGHQVNESFWPHVTVARVSPGKMPEPNPFSIEPVSYPTTAVELVEGRTVFRSPSLDREH